MQAQPTNCTKKVLAVGGWRIALHPFAIGQPHRVRYLDRILHYIMSHDGVWQTTADEIAEYYIANYYDQAVAHAAQLHRQS